MHQQKKITVAHYFEPSRYFYSVALEQAGFDVSAHRTNTPEEVVALLLRERPDLAIISVEFGYTTAEPAKRRMGLDTLVKIRQHEGLGSLPVIMDSDSDVYKREALEKGANGYGAFNSSEALIREVNQHIRQ